MHESKRAEQIKAYPVGQKEETFLRKNTLTSNAIAFSKSYLLLASLSSLLLLSNIPTTPISLKKDN